MAQPLSLKLADGTIVTGCSFLEQTSSVALSSPAVPLLVLVHGGSVNCDSFDVDEKHTVGPFSKFLGVPVVSLNRPGYGGTTPLTSSDGENTFIQRHGRWLHELALPAVWAEFSETLNISSIVLYGCSIGGAVTIVAAGHAGRSSPTYKLSGLVVSAVGCSPDTIPMSRFFGEDYAITGKVIEIPHEFRRQQAAGEHAVLFDDSVFTSRRGESSTTDAEVYDINIQWPTYWSEYAKDVRVQVLYSVGDRDTLWHLDAETIQEFKRAFESSPWVESRLMLNAPHHLEYSYQCSGFLLRVFGFALECAAARDIQEKKDKK